MENEDIRRKARAEGVPFWKIADRLGVSEATLTRIMRRKLDEEKHTQIMTAIDALSREGV